MKNRNRRAAAGHHPTQSCKPIVKTSWAGLGKPFDGFPNPAAWKSDPATQNFQRPMVQGFRVHRTGFHVRWTWAVQILARTGRKKNWVEVACCTSGVLGEDTRTSLRGSGSLRQTGSLRTARGLRPCSFPGTPGSHWSSLLLLLRRRV